MPMGKKNRQSRRGREDFTQEPEEGWLHDDDALAMGEGVFYSFPVCFLGSVKIDESLSALDLNLRTEAIRVMMMRLMIAAGRLKEKKLKKVPPAIGRFAHGEVTVGELPVSLGIAVDGMVVVPNTGVSERDTTGVPQLLFYHSMPMISIAAGGDGETYNLVSYVAKDDTGRREAYIFDCEDHSDEVLATLGQSFVLAQEFAARKRVKPDKEKIRKEYLDVEETVYDTASEAAPVAPEPAIYDTATDAAPVAAQPEYDVGSSAAGGAVVPPVEYNSRPAQDPIYDVATVEIVKVLNKRDSVRRSMKAPPPSTKKSKKKKPPKTLPVPEEPEPEDVDMNSVEQQNLARPSWICISEATDTLPRADLGSLLSQFKAQAVIEEEEED